MYSDTGIRISTVAVGDSNNDGEFEIVAGVELPWDDFPPKGAVFQYKWKIDGVGRAIIQSGDHRAFAIGIGDGNNASKNGVIVGNDRSEFYIFEWDGLHWASTVVQTGNSANRAIHVIPGEGIITTSLYDGTNLYTWDGFAWIMVPIEKNILYAGDSALGDADNDGVWDVIVAGADLEYGGGLYMSSPSLQVP